MEPSISHNSAWKYRLAALTLILVVAVLRVFYLIYYCPLDLAPDEAHYWDWSRHLDWSYYSKGPLVAWVIRLSCELFGTSMPAVRMPAVVFGSLLVWGLYVLTARVHSDRLAFLMVLLALPFPLIAAGSSLMTIDAPYTCLWIWAIIVGHQAIVRGSGWAWPVLGVLLGVGILAKYTMVLLVPCLFAFLLFTPGYRPLLLRPGFWVMCAVGLFCCVPIIYWNATHDWVTIRHTLGHAGEGKAWSVFGPLKYVGTQAALLLGFWFVVWVAAIVRYRPWGETRLEERYLWWMSAPIFGFFWLASLKNGGGEPNWPIATYLAGMVLGAGWLTEVYAAASPGLRRGLLATGGTCTALGILATVLVHDSRPFHSVLMSITGPATEQRPMPLRRVDPTCRLRGWRALAQRVDTLRAELESQGHDVVLAATSWSLPGELGFYCQGHPQAYSVGLATGDRHSQYDMWRPNPLDDKELFAGKTFLIVGDAAPAVVGFEKQLHHERFDYREDTHGINGWPIWIYTGYRELKARDKSTIGN